MTLRNGSWQSCMPTTQNTTATTLRVNTMSMTLIMSQIVDNDEQPSLSSTYLENINPVASLWYPDDCVWWFGRHAAEKMEEFLRDFFKDQILWLPAASKNRSCVYGDLWVLNLFRNGTASMDTVGAFLDGLAWSMTAAMRQTSTSDDSLRRSVSGQTQVVQSCLAVRWVWLSLPASLLGLQLAFLVAIVVISGSAEHWRGDWKDSSLALLYHGLKVSAPLSDEKVESEELRDKDGMFKVARATKVQLRQDKDDWRFHTVP
ncbi:hypothetical protein SLS64_014274 [Diaporthe eres]|uniref:Uncharacterized protein n=1 Tax=Diaporthe eres TaxID=83184 RepID=A0ABR1NZX8_DIAER